MTSPLEEITPEIGKAALGEFVALRLSKYDDEIPQIGKVVSISEQDVLIQWWIGSYYDTWREWREKNQPVQEKMHRNSIIKSGIKFTSAKRLNKKTINELKKIYSLVELI